MAIELSAEDRAGMTPDEIEALTGEDAVSNLRAHGAEEQEADQRTADEEARAAAAAEGAVEVEGEGDPPAAEGEEGALTHDELAVLLAEEDKPPVVASVPYTVDTRDVKAERTAVRTQIQGIDDKWSAGEMTDVERRAALAPLTEKLDDLLIEQTRNETLRTANEQNATEQVNAAARSIAAQAKADKTIDYFADPEAQVEFDAFVHMLAARAANTGKSALQLAQLAHASMLALRGVTKVAPAPTPAVPAARRDVPTATLSGIPAASPVGMENAVLDKLNSLTGEDYEDAFAALPQVEQDRIMRAADAGAMRFSKGTKRAAQGRAHAEAVE